MKIIEKDIILFSTTKSSDFFEITVCRKLYLIYFINSFFQLFPKNKKIDNLNRPPKVRPKI